MFGVSGAIHKWPSFGDVSIASPAKIDDTLKCSPSLLAQTDSLEVTSRTSCLSRVRKFGYWFVRRVTAGCWRGCLFNSPMEICATPPRCPHRCKVYNGSTTSPPIIVFGPKILRTFTRATLPALAIFWLPPDEQAWSGLFTPAVWEHWSLPTPGSYRTRELIYN